MAKVRGEDVVVGLTDDNFPMLCARSVTFDIQSDMIETSITGSGNYRTYKAGAISWTGSIEGLLYLSLSEEYTLLEVYNNFLTGELIQIRWYESDGGSHFMQKSCYAYIESINQTSSFDNIATYTINFRGSGPITITAG
jgi:predicted secreted protein